MVRAFALLMGSCFAIAGCNAQQGSTSGLSAQAQAGEGAYLASDFEGLCKITKGAHVDAPESGNRSTSSSNGTTISVLGSRSQSISSVNGKAVIAVTGAAVLHLTFPNGDLASIETNASADKVEITVGGPDAISCKAVS